MSEETEKPVGLPKYGEPLRVPELSPGYKGYTWIFDNDGFVVCRFGREHAPEEYNERRLRVAGRMVKLMNLFAGVPDEHLEKLRDFSSNEFVLIRACLLHPDEMTPKLMLIDEIQSTPKYQEKVGCYRTWWQLYNKLLEVAEEIQPPDDGSTKSYRYSYEDRKMRKTISEEIREFLAPIESLIQSKARGGTSRKSGKMVTITQEDITTQTCPECKGEGATFLTNGFIDSSCTRCGGSGRI